MSGGALLDLGIGLLLVAYAISGYRHGLVATVFSLVGSLPARSSASGCCRPP
ncbi:MAG: hypothetical protein ABIZ07_10735 [Dermatophilaceae bacterium]